MKAASFILLYGLGLLTWAFPIAESGLAKRSDLGNSIAGLLTVRSEEEEDDEDVIYTDYKNKRAIQPEEDDEDVIYTDY